jgi:polysaccharide export outer membrane protein
VQEAIRADVKDYVLGPDDQLVLRVLEAEEISDKPVRIDGKGYVTLPMIGRIRAGGYTTEQFEEQLVERLRKYIRIPQASVSVSEFRSKPVSVLGSVNNPGVIQLGNKHTLIEVLSLAGGIRSDAGHSIKITRQREQGTLPLPNVRDEGEFFVGEVSLKSVIEATNPLDNIAIKPHDVISVPRADLIYVTGEVKKSGGFTLGENENISVLQALALAEGVERTAALGSGRILRNGPNTGKRGEIPVHLGAILAGKEPDVKMQPNDILFVPGNSAKKAGWRAIEAAIQVGTGIIIWRH